MHNLYDKAAGLSLSSGVAVPTDVLVFVSLEISVKKWASIIVTGCGSKIVIFIYCILMHASMF